MHLSLLTTPEDLAAYQEYLKTAQGASLWQSLEWQGYQGALGRETRLYGLRASSSPFTATALVVIDKTALGLSTFDIPRGPLGSDQGAKEELLEAIMEDAKRERCLSLFFSPPTHYSLQTTHSSNRHEQPEASLVLNLTLGEDELLKQMHPKGRYNIGVARKNGVQVKESQDIDSFYALLKETGGRDAFQIRPKNQYEHFLKDLPGSFLLLAYSPDMPKKAIAGLLGVIWGGKGYYYYGASAYASRALMAPYALQSEAIRVCREKGCRTYDLLGISPPEVVGAPRWGAQTHPWEGVTRFKKQFGGKIETYPPEQEIILRPVVKKILEWKRALWK